MAAEADALEDMKQTKLRGKQAHSLKIVSPNLLQTQAVYTRKYSSAQNYMGWHIQLLSSFELITPCPQTNMFAFTGDHEPA